MTKTEFESSLVIYECDCVFWYSYIHACLNNKIDPMPSRKEIRYYQQKFSRSYSKLQHLKESYPEYLL